MKLLPLFNQKGSVVAFALVDDADAIAFGGQKWGIHAAGYAVRYEGSRPILLHREILGLPRTFDGRETDHRNRNRRDCRRENLRIATHAQNMQNRPTHRGSTSQHRGVYWEKAGRRWCGSIRINGRKIRRRFHTEADAAAYAASLRAEHMPFSEEGSAP